MLYNTVVLVANSTTVAGMAAAPKEKLLTYLSLNT